MTSIQITAAIAAVGLLLYAAFDVLKKWQLWPIAAKKTTPAETTPPVPLPTLYTCWRQIVAQIEANGYDAESLPVSEIPKALAIKK